MDSKLDRVILAKSGHEQEWRGVLTFVLMVDPANHGFSYILLKICIEKVSRGRQIEHPKRGCCKK